MGTEKNINKVETSIFEKYESNVRSYCRKYPVIFTRANGSLLYDQDNREYIDFLCGAGALNFGHNNEEVKKEVIRYIEEDGMITLMDYKTDVVKTKEVETKLRKIYQINSKESIIFTKLDETRGLGNIVNLKLDTGKSLSYVTWGQNVPEDLGLLNPQIIAKQLLGGTE